MPSETEWNTSVVSKLENCSIFRPAHGLSPLFEFFVPFVVQISIDLQDDGQTPPQKVKEP